MDEIEAPLDEDEEPLDEEASVAATEILFRGLQEEISEMSRRCKADSTLLQHCCKAEDSPLLPELKQSCCRMTWHREAAEEEAADAQESSTVEWNPLEDVAEENTPTVPAEADPPLEASTLRLVAVAIRYRRTVETDLSLLRSGN